VPNVPCLTVDDIDVNAFIRGCKHAHKKIRKLWGAMGKLSDGIIIA
jgi:hypothetical protein